MNIKSFFRASILLIVLSLWPVEGNPNTSVRRRTEPKTEMGNEPNEGFLRGILKKGADTWIGRVISRAGQGCGPTPSPTAPPTRAPTTGAPTMAPHDCATPCAYTGPPRRPFLSNAELRAAIAAVNASRDANGNFVDNPNLPVFQEYGYPMGAWNVSAVTSFESIFQSYLGGPYDLNCWNTTQASFPKVC